MRNLLLLITMLITTATAFSQLFVRPNPTTSTDSYVFVTDEILFVEQDVNLQVNSAGATNASIYLRDGAQLIQGVIASNNNGTGKLSVYQNTPDDDAWDYTYWCSPVGNPAGGAGNTNFGITKIYDVQSLTDSNVTLTTGNWNGFNSPSLTISTRWTYKYVSPGTEAEGNYQRIWAGDNVPAGFGFLMKGVNNGGATANTSSSGAGNHDQIYDFRGRPNNGSFLIPVANGMMTLAGNPYPSAIDLAMVVNNNLNVSTIHFWDEDRSINSHYYSANRGGYASWVPVGGAGVASGGTEGTYTVAVLKEWDASGGNGGGATGGTGSGLQQRRFAPIGQGFMLIGSAGGNATISNNMRIYKQEGSNSDFRAPGDGVTLTDPGNGGGATDPADPDPTPAERWPELRMNTTFLNTTTGGTHFRQMVLLFSNTSTIFYDHGMDGLHPMDATSEIYFPIKDNNNVESPYVIQTVPFVISRKVPVNFKLSSNNKITVELVDEVNFNETAYLLNRYDQSITQISGGMKAELYLEAGEHNNRFAIVFQNRREAHDESEGTIIQEETRANVDFFQNNPIKQLEISNPEGYDIKSALVYDMAGKLVITKYNLGSARNLQVSTSNLSDGVYLIKLLTSEDITIDYKMVIFNR